MQNGAIEALQGVRNATQLRLGEAEVHVRAGVLRRHLDDAAQVSRGVGELALLPGGDAEKEQSVDVFWLVAKNGRITRRRFGDVAALMQADCFQQQGGGGLVQR